MNVLDRKLFNRGARDELRRKGGIMASSEPMMQAVGYENGGGVLSNIFNYFRTPTYVDPEISGRENFEIDYREESPNPEVELQMKVLEKAKAGKQVKNAALDLGETLLDVLNLGGGAAVLGANEVAALGLDTLGILTGGGDVSKSILRFAENVRQKGLVNRNDLFDADGNLTLNTRLVGEGPYEGQLEKAKERLQETLKRQGILSDEEKDQIRRESLANIASYDQLKPSITGNRFNETLGVFADTGESIPAFSTTDPLGQGFRRVDGTEIAPKADEPFPQPFVGDATFPVGAKTMPSSRLNPTSVGGGVFSDPTLFGRGPSLNPIEQGVVSALPSVVNEPPADMPQTMKERISEKLVDLGAGGIENIGNLFESGVDKLQGFISGDQTPPAPTDERYAPELTTEAGPEAERTVSEELLEAATSIVPQLTNKATEIMSNLTDPTAQEDAPEIDKGEASTDQDNTPVIKKDEKVLEVKEPENPDAPAFSEKVITTLKNNRGFDPVATGIVEKITNRDLAGMSGDQDDVKDDESFDSYVSKYMKQYQELFKEDEAQIAKDKGFAMAIFGSVFASTGDFGQASAAMIDMLRGDKATRQARADKVKMLAINTAADRKAADLRYRRELAVASVRSSGSNQYTEDRERSRLREEIIKNPFGHAENIYKDGKIDPELLNKYVDDIIKGSKGSTGTGEATKTAKKLNDEAKAAGKTIFTFNGLDYPVQ
tara:strand:- start:57 stop:2210 length:2154 start_codon:yes stop_codon:yes gene_type:complete